MTMLDDAYDLFDAGELAQSAEACRRILAQDAASFGALYLLGTILGEQGSLDAGIDVLKQAVALRPEVKAAQFNLASLLARIGAFSQALAHADRAVQIDAADCEARLLKATCCAGLGQWSSVLDECREALRVDARYAPAHVTMAEALHALGRTDEALMALSTALVIDPQFAQAMKQRALVLKDARRYDEAFADINRLIGLKQDEADAYHTRGLVLFDMKRFEDAIADFTRAIVCKPAFAEAFGNRGAALHQLKRYEEALADFERALALKPDYVEALSNRGSARAALKQFDAALADQNRALEMKPDFLQARINRGALFTETRRHEAALADLAQVLAVRPICADAFFNRGVIFSQRQQFEDALAEYERAIEAQPDYAEAYLNKGFLELSLGRFEPGWRNCEWRLKLYKQPDYPQPRLASLAQAAGRTILVYSEQGLGDVVQFCRYAPMLADAGAQVLFQPPPQLRKLLSHIEGPSVRLIGAEDRPRFDARVALLSLPFIFNTSVATVPPPAPNLFVDPERVAKWAAHLGAQGFKIGICWKGSSIYKADADRSFALSQFDALSRIPGARLISLHRGEGEGELQDCPPGMIVETLGDDFDAGADAFLDTVAVMKSLDLVISSDTSIAHVAGVLGVPVWTALCATPDFRWMLERADTPWYPTMRLFRQKTLGDWPQVFSDMEAAVRDMMRA